MNCIKQIIVLIMLLIEIVDFLSILSSLSSNAKIISSAVNLITLIIVLSTTIAFRQKGLQTSGNVFIFWITTAVAEIFRYRSILLSILSSTSFPESSNLVDICLTLARLPTVSAALLLSLRNDGVPTIKYDSFSDEGCDAETNSTFGSRITFWWILPLMKMGKQKNLEDQDVPPLVESNCASVLANQFRHHLRKDLKLSVYKCVWRQFKASFIFFSILQVVQSLLMFLNPIFLNLLIDFVKFDDRYWRGYLYCILLLASNIIRVIISEYSMYSFFVVAIKIKSVLSTIIYEKALRLSNKSKREWTSGEIVNLVAVDVQRIYGAMRETFLITSCAVQIPFVVYFLMMEVGLSSLAGIALLLFLVPINALLSSVVSTIQMSFMEQKDERVKMITEVINGIKVLKLYAWELPFQDIIIRLRDIEVTTLRKSIFIEIFLIGCFIASPFFVSLLTFATFVFGAKEVLTPNIAFVSISLINILGIPVGDLPFFIGLMIKSHGSVIRINRFLNSDEMQTGSAERPDNESDESAISVVGGNFSWNKDDIPNLRAINLEVKKGSLVAVVGQVGSGKSSLISAILGEMHKESGQVITNGKMAYVPQQAWIQNDTVYNNIIFNSHMDCNKYKMVVSKCALKSDFEILPAGDSTEIGEKGINLSGGQKQRVSLARAVYNDADVYLFDDPLSAVDSHVGKHIFDKVIGKNGILKTKTRVLVTHGLKYLPDCDCIYVLKDSEIIMDGSYDDLLKDVRFAAFVQQNEDNCEEDEKIDVPKYEIVPQSPNPLTTVEGFITSMEHSMIKQNSGRLVDEEAVEEGKVDLSVYVHYFKCAGPIFFICMFIGFGLNSTFDVMANQWLTSWSLDPTNNDFYVSIYTLFGVLQVMAFVFALTTFTHGSTKSSKHNHNLMLKNILRAPMSFFDKTPIGRILNRFSQDINNLDTILIFEMEKFVFTGAKVIGAIVIICINLPYFIIFVAIVGLIYFAILGLAIQSIRQLMRIESVNRSPVYSHVQESILGMSSIKAYDVVDQFICKMNQHLDTNQKFLYSYIAVQSWLGVWLQILGSFIVFFTALIGVLNKGTLNSAEIGLIITYSLNITLALYKVVHSATMIESNIVSVERILQYTKLPQEAELELLTEEEKTKWPSKGGVKFESYQTRYRPGLDLVLKGINVDILPAEKIGIVGRTGAGKSSLTLSLFRIIESCGGRITIDGVDISSVGLHDLRKQLTIIPQDPVLFSGTFRLNVDPFSSHSDEEIWVALRHAHLDDFVKEKNCGLHYLVSEGGDNLSVGQRQLICLARALLRHTKILVLDEATAAIDLSTDEFIQNTIRKEFADCTILTIAHRLNTIMDSDRVMVISDGVVAECDSPSTLLADETSIFYGMASDAGLCNDELNSKAERLKIE